MNLWPDIPDFVTTLITFKFFYFKRRVEKKFSTDKCAYGIFNPISDHLTSSEAHKGTAQLFKLQNNTNLILNDKIDLNGSKKLFSANNTADVQNTVLFWTLSQLQIDF